MSGRLTDTTNYRKRHATMSDRYVGYLTLDYGTLYFIINDCILYLYRNDDDDVFNVINLLKFPSDNVVLVRNHRAGDRN